MHTYIIKILRRVLYHKLLAKLNFTSGNSFFDLPVEEYVSYFLKMDL